jgi:hypothetical protein
MKVNINRVKEILEELAMINREDIENLTFIENNIELQIPPERIKAFKFIGLNNTDFIKSDFYKDEELEELFEHP